MLAGNTLCVRCRGVAGVGVGQLAGLLQDRSVISVLLPFIKHVTDHPGPARLTTAIPAHFSCQSIVPLVRGWRGCRFCVFTCLLVCLFVYLFVVCLFVRLVVTVVLTLDG